MIANCMPPETQSALIRVNPRFLFVIIRFHSWFLA
jgi:hypothetical protein